MSAAIPHNLLAEWLDRQAPQGPPVELEAEVCEAVTVLWADRAAPPTVPVAALIGDLRFGPFSSGGAAPPHDEWSPRADEFLPEEEDAWGDPMERAEAAELQALLAGSRGAMRGQDVDAVLVALNPMRAEGPEVDLEALVATVREGPLAREAEVLPFVAPHRGRSRNVRGWWLAAAGSLAMAAGLLLTVLPIAKEQQGSRTAPTVPPILEEAPTEALPEMAAVDAPPPVNRGDDQAGGEGTTMPDPSQERRKDAPSPGGAPPKSAPLGEVAQRKGAAEEDYSEKKAEKSVQPVQFAAGPVGGASLEDEVPNEEVDLPAPPPPPPSSWIPEVSVTESPAGAAYGRASASGGEAAGSTSVGVAEEQDELSSRDGVVVAQEKARVLQAKPARAVGGRGDAAPRPRPAPSAPQAAPAENSAREERKLDSSARMDADDSVQPGDRWAEGDRRLAAGDRAGAEAAWAIWLTDPDPEVATEAAFRVGRSRLRRGDVVGARAVVGQGLARVDASTSSLARLQSLERQITLQESRTPAGAGSP